MPIGTFTRNSHGHVATDRISEATVGPAVPPTATDSAIIAGAADHAPRMKSRLAADRACRPCPRPGAERPAIRTGSDGASAQASDDSVNRMRPRAPDALQSKISPNAAAGSRQITEPTL